MKRHRWLWLLYLGLIVGWVLLDRFGPVDIAERADETVYTHNYLVRFTAGGAALLVGAWLALQHLQAYGLWRTFRSDYDKWDANMRDSAIGLSLFAFALLFVGFTIWGYLDPDYVAVSAAGVREGSGTWAPGASQIQFRGVKSIDMNYHETTGVRRGWCLRFVGPGDQERLLMRQTLVNAAVPQIVEAARKHGVHIVND